jgi:hypothetical protein
MMQDDANPSHARGSNVGEKRDIKVGGLYKQCTIIAAGIDKKRSTPQHEVCMLSLRDDDGNTYIRIGHYRYKEVLGAMRWTESTRDVDLVERKRLSGEIRKRL